MQLRRLLSSLERGDLEVAARPTGLEPILRRVERIANRVVLGILAAAFIVALSVLLYAYRVRNDAEIGVVLIIGFLIAIGLGIYMTWSILRSGRS